VPIRGLERGVDLCHQLALFPGHVLFCGIEKD